MRALGCPGHSQLPLHRSSTIGMHSQEFDSESKHFLRCEAAGHEWSGERVLGKLTGSMDAKLGWYRERALELATPAWHEQGRPRLLDDDLIIEYLCFALDKRIFFCTY